MKDLEWKMPENVDTLQQSVALAKEFEHRVDIAMQIKNKKMHHSQKGRGTTTAAVKKSMPSKPQCWKRV